jgi:hypothetical protein
MNPSARPGTECKARYRIPADESLYALAKHYYLTRTNLLLAYMANWILLSNNNNNNNLL